jgi:hypothetical protein
LISCIFGENRDIFFPKLSDRLHLISFADIAIEYLRAKGYEPYLCSSEDEARDFFIENSKSKVKNSNYYPCLFTNSDTTGEKDFEEFFTENESLDMDRFKNLGVIKNSPIFDNDKLNNFQKSIKQIKNNNIWSKKRVVELFLNMIPNFQHKESGKYLDSKM